MAEPQTEEPRLLRDADSKGTVDTAVLLERFAGQTAELERAKVRLEQAEGATASLKEERRARTAAVRELNKERSARHRLEKELDDERSATRELHAELAEAARHSETLERQVSLSWTQLQTLEADLAWQMRPWWRRILRRPPARRK